MASTRKTWLWVVLGIVGTVFLVFCIAVGGVIYEFRTHVKTEVVEETVAEQEFNQTRERFKGQEPIVEFTGNSRGDDESKVHRPPASATRVQIHNLRVLVHDLDNGRLIRATVPGWLLRLMPNGRYSGFEGDDTFDRHQITIADLERHGLGLIVDGHNRSSRILIWSE